MSAYNTLFRQPLPVVSIPSSSQVVEIAVYRQPPEDHDLRTRLGLSVTGCVQIRYSAAHGRSLDVLALQEYVNALPFTEIYQEDITERVWRQVHTAIGGMVEVEIMYPHEGVMVRTLYTDAPLDLTRKRVSEEGEE